jgi:hypothetical protein
MHMNGLLANGDACYAIATIAKPITDRVIDIFEKERGSTSRAILPWVSCLTSKEYDSSDERSPSRVPTN